MKRSMKTKPQNIEESDKLFLLGFTYALMSKDFYLEAMKTKNPDALNKALLYSRFSRMKLRQYMKSTQKVETTKS